MEKRIVFLIVGLFFGLVDQNSGFLFAQESSVDELISKPIQSSNKNLKVSAIMSDWVLNGTEIYNLSTEVGIGTSTPSYKLDILHTGGTGLNVQSSSSFSVIDIDAFSGDAALRFAKNGVNQWNVRNDPSTNNLQIFELGGGGERFQIQNTTGNLGLNDPNPTEKLSIVGRIKMNDPSKGINKVLTSDANGVGTWQNVGTSATGWAVVGSNMYNSGLGFVGIGTSTTNAPMQFANILANRKIVLYEEANNDHQFYGFGINSGTLRYQVASGGNHIFYANINGSTSKELFKIASNGNITAAGVISFTSDMRLKKDINHLENVLQKLASVNGYSFHWQDKSNSDKLQIGLMAQEVEQQFPELVEANEDGFKSVNYNGLVPVLLEGVKDLQKQLEQKSVDILQLKEAIEELKLQIAKISSDNNR